MDVLARQNTSTGERMHDPENISVYLALVMESNGYLLLVNKVASSKC